MFGASYRIRKKTYLKIEIGVILKYLKSAMPANGSTKQLKIQELFHRHGCRIIATTRNTPSPNTAQKHKFFIKDLFSKYDLIRRILRI